MAIEWPAGTRRRGATAADVDAVLAAVRASEAADLGEALTTRDDLAGDWSRPSVDLAVDVVVVEADGEVVAYAEEFQGRAFVEVRPAHRGRGIGTALAAWTEEHARAAGREQVGQTVPDVAAGAHALLRSRGYTPRWESWLLGIDVADADLRERELPDGIGLRTMRRPDDERAAHAVVERAFSEWPDRDEGMSFEDWRAASLDRDDVPDDLVLLLESAGEVVGVLIGSVDGDEGWVDALAVAREHRNRGLAQALLAAAFVRFRDRGLPRAGLSTDSRTGALGLYERVGMQVTSSFTRLSLRL